MRVEGNDVEENGVEDGVERSVYDVALNDSQQPLDGAVELLSAAIMCLSYNDMRQTCTVTLMTVPGQGWHRIIDAKWV